MKFDLIYADPAWPYKGSNAAGLSEAGNHYDLMSWDELAEMPVADYCNPKAALLMWGTGPFLDKQIKIMNEWGFHYRGVAFVWIKTNKDGSVMGARGGVPTFTKSLCEYVLFGSTNKTGRPFPIHSYNTMQPHFAQQTKHSRKPESIRQEIDKVCGPDVLKLELFARRTTDAPNWVQSGLELNGCNYKTGNLIGEQL